MPPDALRATKIKGLCFVEFIWTAGRVSVLVFSFSIHASSLALPNICMPHAMPNTCIGLFLLDIPLSLSSLLSFLCLLLRLLAHLLKLKIASIWATGMTMGEEWVGSVLVECLDGTIF